MTPKVIVWESQILESFNFLPYFTALPIIVTPFVLFFQYILFILHYFLTIFLFKNISQTSQTYTLG